jgi:hypothetical protein
MKIAVQAIIATVKVYIGDGTINCDEVLTVLIDDDVIFICLIQEKGIRDETHVLVQIVSMKLGHILFTDEIVSLFINVKAVNVAEGSCKHV